MNWPTVKLDNIFDVARGGSPRPIDSFITDDINGVNWIMIGDTQEGEKYIIKTNKKIRADGVKHSRAVKEGDFLLTNSMSFGRPYILKTSGCIHDGWLVLSPKSDQIHRDYFYHYLGSESIKKVLASKAAGAVVKNLNKEIVQNLEIPLPPLEEQKRIAAILDKADSIRCKRQEAIKLADEFLRAVFLDMFGDPVTNPNGWEIVGFEHFCEINPRIDKLDDSIEVSFVPMQRVSENSHHIDLSETRLYSEVKKGFTAFKEGDILFAKITPCMENGKAGIAAGLKNGFGFGSTEFHILRPRKQSYTYFLYNLIHLDIFRNQAASNFSGAVGHKRVPKDFFIKYPLYKAPDNLIIRYNSIVEKVSKSILKITKHELISHQLFNSLSQRAFSGEL